MAGPRDGAPVAGDSAARPGLGRSGAGSGRGDAPGGGFAVDGLRRAPVHRRYGERGRSRGHGHEVNQSGDGRCRERGCDGALDQGLQG